MNKIIIFLIFFSITIKPYISIHAQNHLNQSADTLRVLDKAENFDARIYVFIDINSCEAYEKNISTIYNIFSNYKLEFVVIYYKMNEISIKNKIIENNWKFKVISDEYGIYKDFYNIKYFPTIIITDNNGKLLEKCKLTGAEFNIKKSKELIEKNIDTTLKSRIIINLKEIKRFNIYNDNTKMLSSEFRNIIFNQKLNQYFLRNSNKCPIYIIDSTGKVIDFLDRKSNPEFECYFPYFGFSWAIQDSILFLYDMNSKFKASFQFFDVFKKELSESKEIIINKNTHRDNSSIENNFNTNKNRIILTHFSSGEENFFLKNYDTTLFVYDTNGIFLFSFGNPDSIYQKFKISDRFMEMICFDDSGNIYSIQNFSKNLKYWDQNGNLIKKFVLDFSNYRDLNCDISAKLTTAEAIDVWNKISTTWFLKRDNKNGNILVGYRNMTYPPGVLDFFSDEAKREVYLHIINKDGEHLTSSDILMPGSCKPFHFENSMIYATELDSKSNLQIVIYKFEPK